MRFVGEKTIILIPESYGFDKTQINIIGAPYMAMRFIPGYTVTSKWFDKDGQTPLEERRMRISSSVAKGMCQLQRYGFHAVGSHIIGSLKFNGTIGKDTIETEPCYDWDEGPLGEEDFSQKLEVQAFGPFETLKLYLQHYLDHMSKRQDSRALNIGAKRSPQ